MSLVLCKKTARQGGLFLFSVLFSVLFAARFAGCFNATILKNETTFQILKNTLVFLLIDGILVFDALCSQALRGSLNAEACARHKPRIDIDKSGGF